MIKIYFKRYGQKRELLTALKILGEKLTEKGYNKNKIIRFCRKIRNDIYNAEIKE